MNISTLVEENDKKTQLKQVNSISDITNHLSSTIDVFRSFFQDNNKNESIIIKDIVYNCLDIIGPILKTNNIKLHLDFNEDCKINIPPNELKQVILNLIKNAEDILINTSINNPTIWISSYIKD